jgi:universal stress protein A
MLSVRSILCPVDFSEPSRQALRWAATIAQRRGGELTAVSVVEPLLAQAAGIRLHVDLAHADVEPALHEFVDATLPESLRQASRVRMEVTVGDTAEAILQTARRLKAGLIVLGTHGLGGFRKALLGSTTEQVLRRTEWPVLAVPPGAVSAPGVEHPGVQLKKILVATDFRESAMAAMQWAGDLASDISVPLVLAHVVEPVVVSPLWQPLVADLDSDHVASAQRTLTRLAAGFRNTHNDSVVSVGHPADTIASLAGEHEAGLVVMGLANAEDSEVRKPGSIAYRVLRIAHVAVVVVPRSATRAALDRVS